MKPYVKPEMFYESFELSENIAACAWDMPNATYEQQCVARSDPDFLGTGEETLFNVGNCSITDYQVYCYQNGTEGLNVFNS